MKNKSFSLKTIILLLTIGVLIGGAVGGTLAWLIDSTDPVTNTFTAGDIDIELTESDKLNLKMIPGAKLAKDPVVTVKADSEACWLFVKLTESCNVVKTSATETTETIYYGFRDYIDQYNIAEGWTKLPGVSGVYYRSVSASTVKQPFNVLAGDSSTDVLKDGFVHVNEDATRDMLNKVTSTEAPKLVVQAFAIQKAGFEDNVSGAWSEISTSN